MSVMMVGAAATVASAAIGANASSKAAKAQQQATDKATELQREQFDRQVELNEPFRQGGLKANNRLLYLMGLDPGGVTDVEPTAMETADQVRARLAPKYQQTGQAAPSGAGDWAEQQMDFMRNGSQVPGAGAPIGGAADAGLDAAVEAEMARLKGERGTQDQNALDRAIQDPEYGSLMRDFGMKDFQEDPGYKFRVDEGARALKFGAAAAGRIGSGRYLKDLTRFGQDMGSQEYGRAYDRFQINRGNKLNPLQSLLGVGQTATQRVGDAGQSYASNAGNTIMAGGNARASGYVGKANAVNGAINQGWGMYQDNQLMNQLKRPSGWQSPGYGAPGMNGHFFGNGTGGD
jgi:hypothetical protein